MVDYNPHTNQGANGGGLIRISFPRTLHPVFIALCWTLNVHNKFHILACPHLNLAPLLRQLIICFCLCCHYTLYHDEPSQNKLYFSTLSGQIFHVSRILDTSLFHISVLTSTDICLDQHVQ